MPSRNVQKDIEHWACQKSDVGWIGVLPCVQDFENESKGVDKCMIMLPLTV